MTKNCQKQNQQATKQPSIQQFQEHKTVIQITHTKQQTKKKPYMLRAFNKSLKKNDIHSLRNAKKKQKILTIFDT